MNQQQLPEILNGKFIHLEDDYNNSFGKRGEIIRNHIGIVARTQFHGDLVKKAEDMAASYGVRVVDKRRIEPKRCSCCGHII